MKKEFNFQLLILLIILATGCTKELEEPATMDGNYAGEIEYPFNNNLVVLPINRAIRGNITTWYTSPVIESDFNPEGISYPIEYKSDKSGSCLGVQYLHLWIYAGTGLLQNDSLIESGTYDYKCFAGGKEVTHVTGTWKAWFVKTEIWRPLK